MASSVVEIWNIALIRIGHSSVESETEDSREVDVLNTVWEGTRDRMLEDYDWDFARRNMLLTPIGDATELVDNWLFAYEWPSVEALTFRGVPNPVVGGDEIPYTTMLKNTGLDRKILTDLEDARGVFTIKVTDVTRYTPGFTDALSIALEAEIVRSISKDKADQVRALQLFKASNDRARALTANQAEPRKPDDKAPRSIAARG